MQLVRANPHCIREDMGMHAVQRCQQDFKSQSDPTTSSPRATQPAQFLSSSHLAACIRVPRACIERVWCRVHALN